MNESSKRLFFFAGALAILLLAIAMRLGMELADDGAFFLRYAENMVAGDFWVWNKGEAPVWGASAPLYPLLVALPIALGVPSIPALVGTGMFLASVSLAFVGLILAIRFGYVAGAAFVTLAAIDTGAMYFSGSGLETPLTFALLGLGVWALLGVPRFWIVGLVAGLLMVQKLDLVPAGVFLLVAYWLRVGRVELRAAIIAVAIALVWYGFAWGYFGAPVPNSFLTKSLHQDNHPKIIDWRWFGGFVLIGGIHKWLSFLSVVGTIHKTKKASPLILFLGGTLFTHLVAYTIKYPFEPYNWYCMPSVFALLVLGAIGVSSLTELSVKRFPRLSFANIFFPVLLVGGVLALELKSEMQITASIKQFASNHELDRSNAGRWVRDNTPSDFRVFTLWGNPAYYSQRYVFDGSFLNRRYESADLVKKYHPEILVLQNNPGSTPMNPVFAATKGEGYKVVKVFDETYSKGMDYFFAVLAREDVIDKITNVEQPSNLMRYVQDVKIGSEYGLLKVNDRKTLFVHPGISPTSFEIDSRSLARDLNKKEITVEAAIAPNVPLDAVKRGAAVVKLSIFDSKRLVADAVIRDGNSFRTVLPEPQSSAYRFVVDNYNGPDTDWLLLSIQ